MYETKLGDGMGLGGCINSRITIMLTLIVDKFILFEIIGQLMNKVSHSVKVLNCELHERSNEFFIFEILITAIHT